MYERTSRSVARSNSNEKLGGINLWFIAKRKLIYMRFLGLCQKTWSSDHVFTKILGRLAEVVDQVYSNLFVVIKTADILSSSGPNIEGTFNSSLF